MIYQVITLCGMWATTVAMWATPNVQGQSCWIFTAMTLIASALSISGVL